VTARRKLGHCVCIGYSDFVKETVSTDSVTKVWGPYPNYNGIARFDYGRLLWRSPQMRSRLLRHWRDARHPYRERFELQREVIEAVLSSTEPAEELDRRLRAQSTSLRCVAREIPPVFGSFF